MEKTTQPMYMHSQQFTPVPKVVHKHTFNGCEIFHVLRAECVQQDVIQRMKPHRVAALVTDPPHVKLNTRQNTPICDPPL